MLVRGRGFAAGGIEDSSVTAPCAGPLREVTVQLPPDARFDTICIHAGQAPDPSTGAIITPIYQTSTYVQDGLGRHKGHEYARTSNPTRAALEANLAALEGGKAGYAFASGMAAIDAILSLLQQGDHVIVTDNTYGGTYRLFERVLRRYGLRFSYVDTSDTSAVAQAIEPETKMVFLETPTNPVMRLTDIAAVAAITAPRGITLVVDNTFASPCLQQPLALGADIVVHSTTKYLNGHSDSVGGIAVCVRDEHIEWMKFVQNAAGAIMGPFDAWLVLRGTKTLAVRMERHNTNGLAVARFLAQHPRVRAVHYPGLDSHSQHALALRQMRGFGGMLSFDVDTLARATIVLERFRVFALAESLGGVESLVCHPASMTHASVPIERRAQIGLTESMVRLSVGIEDVHDLLADVAHALEGLA